MFVDEENIPKKEKLFTTSTLPTQTKLNINTNISEHNAQFLHKNLSPNYIKLPSKRLINNNDNISNQKQPETTLNNSNPFSFFTNALTNTIQNIPNTFSNLRFPTKNTNDNISPFSPPIQTENNEYIKKNKNQNTFSNIFGIHTNPNSTNSSLTQPKSQINLNKYQISVCVSNFETKLAGVQGIFLFKIDLYSDITKNEWSVFHEYDSFYKLNEIFKKFYSNPPYFPIQSIRFGNFTELVQLIHQKESLNIYIKEVANRPDLLTSPYAIHFLKLENHYPDINLYRPLDMYDLKDELSLPISCAYFHEQTNLLFLGMGKPNNNIINGFISKVKGFSLFKSSSQTKQIKGQLVVYNIIKNYQGVTHFEPLYSKALYSECINMNYYREKNCLVLGLNDGNVALFKVFITESTEESQGEFIIEAGVVSCHKQPIIGSVVNFQYGYIYTMAKDVYIKISELNYQTLMKEFVITNRNLSAMKYDDKWGRIILGDEGGVLYIVDIKTAPLTPKVIQMVNCQLPSIKCIYLNDAQNIMFIGTKGGNVNMYKIEHYNEKIIPQMYKKSNIDFIKMKELVVSSTVDVNDIVITNKNEMVFALSNGSIFVYTNDCNNPEFVIDAHLESVSKIFWGEDRKVLISCSEDKSVKMCQFPIYWPGEMIINKSDFNKKKRNAIGKMFGFESNEEEKFSNRNRNTNGEYILSEKEVWSEDLDGWSIDI